MDMGEGGITIITARTPIEAGSCRTATNACSTLRTRFPLENREALTETASASRVPIAEKDFDPKSSRKAAEGKPGGKAGAIGSSATWCAWREQHAVCGYDANDQRR